jgi:hypothetical protein
MDAGLVHPIIPASTPAARQEMMSGHMSAVADVFIRLGDLLFKDPALERNDYGVSAVARFKLRQNTLNVSLDGMH